MAQITRVSISSREKVIRPEIAMRQSHRRVEGDNGLRDSCEIAAFLRREIRVSNTSEGDVGDP